MKVADEGRTKVLYIVGSSRTGSGILARVLSTIDGASYAGELRRLYSRGLREGRTCACGRAHAECPVWSKLLLPGAPYLQPGLRELGRLQAQAAPDHHSWWAAQRHLRRDAPPPPDTPAHRYLDVYSELHRAFAEATGATLVINSSKSPADAALLFFAPELSVYCVHMVRDPRGVVFSFQRHAEKTRGLGARVMAARAALLWLAKHLAAERVLRRYGPERSLLVRYEGFVDDPKSTVDAVAKLAGLASPIVALSSGIPITVPEAHGPDGSRWLRFVGTEVTVAIDDRWRSQLAPIDRLLATLLTLPLLHRYGYPVRVRRGHRTEEPALG